MREIFKDKVLLWFREYEPQQTTIDDLIKEFNGVLFEFYNLTLNVSKVEKGIYLDINTFEDLARLANVLKNNVTVSQYEYSIEDKIYPFIKKLYLLYI